ncbi:MAG: hypothetical protein V4541_08955 [Bacteroidota bacterium]
MKLFKRNKEAINPDSVAQKIAGNIISKQQKLAGYLNAKTKNISAKTWLFILTGFCVVFGSYCAYLLVAAFN